MIDKSKVKVLIVDDEPEVRNMIADFLEDDEGYTVFTADNGQHALEILQEHTEMDMVVSDINMPVMRGFDLLNEVRRLYPHMKRVLITAYNVEDYLELALKHDVGNIFVKTTPFNFDELARILQNLLTGDIFGVERYFGANTNKQTLRISRGDSMEENARTIIQSIPGSDSRSKLELVLIELLTNAIFYGVRGERPDQKETWEHDFELAAHDAVTATVAWDDEKYGISIVDNGGRLKKQDVLYWLNRQISRDEKGLPVGLFDSHGRGLFIARKYIDRLVINIDRDRKTELIIINYMDTIYHGYKPLYINEL